MSSRPSRGAARLAAILDALPDALVLVNANGTVVNANTIALEAFEAPGTALVGRGLLDLLPEFDSRLIPGSMRRPDTMDPTGRTKPTRMTARRTDGSEFPVEVTSANLENGQQAYDGYGSANDELLMLVVRDLSGTVDTEAELARSQRQTEMILRAASEGVVGTDTDGRIVLVNPAAAQILGYRASDLGGRELHTLVLHSREDGAPFPYGESPLADTLRSGRKHRVRGQVLWSKNGEKVSVDLTTAPVRDGDQLVGAVMTFTDRRPYDKLAEEKDTEAETHAEELERLAKEHAAELAGVREEHAAELAELSEQHVEELAAGDERYAALGEREKDRYEALAARHEQLLAVLGTSLRGPLDQLRSELGTLAADDAGQLWPEANQVLHHLTAGYSRITTLIDNVLGYQRIDAGEDGLVRTAVMLDAVVAAGVDGAVELVGPGRVQFAVHAPPIEAEVDQVRLATALAHLVADVAGVDATGNAPMSTGGYMDNTVVVAAAQRGEVVRIEVRGPYAGGDPVHQPIVQGIVRAHGGVLQTVEVPGMSGSAYVLEVPLGGGAGAVPAAAPPAVTGVGTDSGPMATGAEVALPEQAPVGGGRRRARRSSVDAFLESEDAPEGQEVEAGVAPTGRRRRRAEDTAVAAGAANGVSAAAGAGPVPVQGVEAEDAGGARRRRGQVTSAGAAGEPVATEGAVVMAAEHAAGAAAAANGLGGTVPPQGVPAPSGRRARREPAAQNALPPALPAGPSPAGEATADDAGSGGASGAQPTGRRRRALASAEERPTAPEPGARPVFALPPAEADRGPEYAQAAGLGPVPLPAAPGAPGAPLPMPLPAGNTAASVPAAPGVADVPVQGGEGYDGAGSQGAVGTGGGLVPAAGGQPVPTGQPVPAGGPVQAGGVVPAGGPALAGGPVPAAGIGQQVAGVGQQIPQGGAVAPGGIAGPGAAQVVGAGQAVGVGQAVGAAQVVGAGQAAGAAQDLGAGQAVGAGQIPGVGQVAAAGQTSGAPAGGVDDGRHDAAPHHPADDHTPPQPHPVPTPTGRRRAVRQPAPQQGDGVATMAPAQGVSAQGAPAQGIPPQGGPGQSALAQGAAVAAAQPVSAQGVPGGPQQAPTQAVAAAPGQPVPAGVAAGQPVAPQGVPGGAVQAQAAVGQPVVPQGAVPPPGVPGNPQQAPAQVGALGQSVLVPGVQGVQGVQAVQGVQSAQPVQGTAQPVPAQGVPGAQQPVPAQAAPQPQTWPDPRHETFGAGIPVTAPQAPLPPQSTPSSGTPLPPEVAVQQQPRVAQPLPAEATAPAPAPAPAPAQVAPATPAPSPVDPNSTHGRAISVRTLGQGVPFSRQGGPQAPQAGAQTQTQTQTGATPAPNQPGGSGRRRKLGTPPQATGDRPETGARPHPQSTPTSGTGLRIGTGQTTPSAQAAAQLQQAPAQVSGPSLAGQAPLPAQPSLAGQVPLPPQPSLAGQSRLTGRTEGAGRSYAIGAPDENAAEGPEPLDGPGGAVEVPDRPHPQPMDDELPPEPLDNPRRLLVWPAPDAATHQALSDRGYRPVIVNSREDVDAQIAAYPAALFVDPLTGPITRTALQSLRQAAVAAEVPVLVTAGLGQATREAAYGADPAILLKALAPRDSEQHPPRVLLIEEHAEIALALTATLERRGMQVARAASDADGVTLAAQMRPNLVVMDLLQVHRRQAGIIDWLRTNGQLNRTPLVVYTAAVDQSELPRLASGETVLFLAERSTSTEVQTRIVDLLARVGTN
ncbi:PAS domain-containing protein [Streptomyces europaeiscabiei]|uniref:hybrid sensor histidine kinase/response regulator n=1 Tax=Streptomyces europaeiscabiei TaxID=146819 RepID=UPI0029ADA600|nr:PAS domain-containing protein [Streptomyces europaeiscabiei]MDX3636671.1 PAS domain-containing protein [Streptomyces europaeiscabiei]MDX3654756.1 PAS domain-containing protein [Streptomyces europaeiscabiei]